MGAALDRPQGCTAKTTQHRLCSRAQRAAMRKRECLEPRWHTVAAARKTPLTLPLCRQACQCPRGWHTRSVQLRGAPRPDAAHCTHVDICSCGQRGGERRSRRRWRVFGGRRGRRGRRGCRGRRGYSGSGCGDGWRWVGQLRRRGGERGRRWSRRGHGRRRGGWRWRDRRRRWDGRWWRDCSRWSYRHVNAQRFDARLRLHRRRPQRCGRRRCGRATGWQATR